MASRCTAALRWPQTEPTLAELLADPIVFALMQADRVDPREIAALVSRHARNLPRSAGAKH